MKGQKVGFFKRFGAALRGFAQGRYPVLDFRAGEAIRKSGEGLGIKELNKARDMAREMGVLDTYVPGLEAAVIAARTRAASQRQAAEEIQRSSDRRTKVTEARIAELRQEADGLERALAKTHEMDAELLADCQEKAQCADRTRENLDKVRTGVMAPDVAVVTTSSG